MRENHSYLCEVERACATGCTVNRRAGWLGKRLKVTGSKYNGMEWNANLMG